jgi:hypothetical protein
MSGLSLGALGSLAATGGAARTSPSGYFFHHHGLIKIHGHANLTNGLDETVIGGPPEPHILAMGNEDISTTSKYLQSLGIKR